MIDRDTDIGGQAGRFPATRRSAVRAIRSSDEHERRRAYEVLLATYWKPVYKYLRLKWREPNEEAKDLTQGFFAQALEKGYFLRYDPAKAAFRTYIRKCLDGFVSNQKKAARRLKRGGDAALLSLDFQEAEGEFRQYEIADDVSMEDYFYGEWARSVFSIAVEDLRRDALHVGTQPRAEEGRRAQRRRNVDGNQ